MRHGKKSICKLFCKLIQLNPCFTRNYFSKCSVFLTSVTFDIHNGTFTTKITGSVGLFTQCIVLYNTDICRRKVFSCNKNAKIVKQNGQKKLISTILVTDVIWHLATHFKIQFKAIITVNLFYALFVSIYIYILTLF
jgi:hypothetical protein